MEIFDQIRSLGWTPRAVSFSVLAIASPFVLTWLITTWQSWRAVAAAARAPAGQKRPPTLPSSVPLLGHVIQFMQGRHSFLSNAVKHFGPETPVFVNLAALRSCIVSGQEIVAAFLKDPTRGLTKTSRSLKVMEHAFGCPHELVEEFRSRDDVELEQQIHSTLQGMLSGPRLDNLTRQFQEAVVDQVLYGDARMGDEWTVISDLCAFVERNVFEAATCAMFGPHVVSLNPDVAADFWNFNKHVMPLFMGVPKWLSPASNKARDKMTDHVKRWQRHAAEHCNIDAIPEDVEWEPYYGSKSTRIRQQLLTKRGILDESARAAENLAFMWATNANSVPAAEWFLLETLHNPALKPRVLERLDAARLPIQKPTSNQPLAFDIAALTSDALLQSIYAEILRLRVAVLIVRQLTRDDFSLRGWHIKKNEAVSFSTRTELMDPDIWNAGTKQDPHPLDRFWAERFLVRPDNPKSGPMREPKRAKGAAAAGGDGKVAEPYFSLDGCTWSWVPYGGGRNLCPGRHFAKREIMLTSAILLAALEIELLTDEMLGPDESVFGFGTMPPNGKVPCRMRRRRV